MDRAALVPLLSLLAACGGIGLDPMLTDDGAAFDDEAPGLEAIDVGLRGRTYAAPVSEMEVLYPSQFGLLLASAGDREMLFHVHDEDAQELQIVAALADASGEQDLCDAAVPMPAATWTTNPEFRISHADWSLRAGGNMVTLRDLSLDGIVVDEGQAWDELTLVTTIDTREWSDDLDLCAMGVDCSPCIDGQEACVELALKMQAFETNISFDAQASGDGC
jgi:hypothetical protein